MNTSIMVLAAGADRECGVNSSLLLRHSLVIGTVFFSNAFLRMPEVQVRTYRTL